MRKTLLFKKQQNKTTKAKLCRNALSYLKVFVVILSFEKFACQEWTATVLCEWRMLLDQVAVAGAGGWCTSWEGEGEGRK